MVRRRFIAMGGAAATAVALGILLVPADALAAPGSATSDAGTVTIALSPATLDYHDQTITASGSVTPAAATSVTVTYLDSADQATQLVVTSDASGDYEAIISNLEPTSQAITASTATASASAELDFALDAVTITLNPVPASVPLNSKVTLSGSVTYESGATSYPLSGDDLTITAPFSNPVTATTAADGSFTAKVDAYNLSDSQIWTVTSAATPYLSEAQASVTSNTQWPTGFTSFSVSLSAEGEISLDACAFMYAPLIVGDPLDGPVTYQYSASLSGPWKTLGVPPPVEGTYCSQGQPAGTLTSSYPAYFKAPLANGYYRAVFAGTNDQAPSRSAVLHRWRDQTKITEFAISPRTVGINGNVTVSGRLWVRTTKWIPDAHQKVVIEYRYRGKVYVLKQRLTTSAAGRFRGTFRVPRSARWLAVYDGAKTQFAAATSSIEISVR